MAVGCNVKTMHKRATKDREKSLAVCGSKKAFWPNTTTEWSHVTCLKCREKQRR